MRFFETLEENGFKYDPGGIVGPHIHMPNGLPRYLPAIYIRREKPWIDGNGRATMLFRSVLTTDVEDVGKETYKVVYEMQSVPVPSVEQFTTLEKVEGLFDHEFSSIENGEKVLQKCLGIDSLSL